MDSIVALLDRNSNQGRVQQLRAEFEEYLADMCVNKGKCSLTVLASVDVGLDDLSGILHHMYLQSLPNL